MNGDIPATDEYEWNDMREAVADGFPSEAWPAYSEWVRSGDRSARSVWPLVKATYAVGVAVGRAQPEEQPNPKREDHV